MTNDAHRLEPWRALRHPLWWIALVVLVINDHVLKGAGLVPQVLTGKLSDIAGPIVAPALLAAMVGVRRVREVAICHVVPVAILAALKLLPGVAPAVVGAAAILGETWSIVADPTDVLVAIPAAILAFAVLAPRMRASAGERPRHDARTLILAAVGALACGATSRTPPQAPALVDGQVIAQAWPAGEIHGFDARSGRPTARVVPPESTHADPPLVHEGALWLVSDGILRAIDLASGATRWSHAGGFAAVAGVDRRAVIAFIACDAKGCASPRWAAIDRATKQTLWTARGALILPPVIGEGIVAHAEGERLVVRDATSGAVIWTRTFANDARAIAASGGVLWATEPAADQLLALDARSGAERARFTVRDTAALRHSSRSLMPRWAALGDRLHVVSEGVVHAYAASARGPLWSHPGYGVSASDDAVVVGTADGLACLDAASGQVRWRGVQLGWGGAVTGDGLLVIRNGDTFVDVHELGTGRPLVRFDLDEGRAVPFE